MKLLCVIVFKIRSKSILGLVKVKIFLQCPCWPIAQEHYQLPDGKSKSKSKGEILSVKMAGGGHLFSFPFSTFCTMQLRICNALFVVNKIKPRYIIKSPQSVLTLCFQFVSAATASTAAMTFAPHAKTVSAKP